MKYYSHKKQYGGQIGATTGSAIGSAAVAAIPGVGPLLSPLGGTLGGMIGKSLGSSFDKKPKKVIQSIEGSDFAKGGALPIGKGARKYVGPKHSKGGIPVDENGVPTKRNSAVAEVEGGETVQQGYVFSDRLIVPGTEMTFAQVHEQLVKKGDQKNIEKLAQMQEQMNNRSQMADSKIGESDILELENGGETSGRRGNRRAGSTNYVQTRQQVGISTAKVRGRSPRRVVNTGTTTGNVNPLSRSINPPKVVDPLLDRLSVSNTSKATSGLQEAATYRSDDFVRSTQNSLSDDVANAFKRTGEINPGARVTPRVGSGVLRSAGNAAGKIAGRVMSLPVGIGSTAGLLIGEQITGDTLLGSFNRMRTNMRNAEIAEQNRIAATAQRDANLYRAGWDRGFPFNPVGGGQLFASNDQQPMTQAEIADVVRNNVVQNTPITSNGNESVTTTDQTPAISETVSSFQPRTNILFSGRPGGMRLPRYVRNQSNTRQTNFMGYDEYGNIVPMTGEMPSNINESVRIEGSADTNQSITSTLGLNGTLPATNREIGTLILPENQAPTQDKPVEREKAKFFDTLGSVLPSAMRIGAAIGAPRPTGYGRISYRPLSTTSPTFANEQRRMDAGFRAAAGVNPQAAYASYLDASSGLAAREAEFRAAREEANEQRRAQAEATNLDLRAREKQEREADMGQRISLALEGVSMPFQQRMMDSAAKRTIMANAAIVAGKLPEVEREGFMNLVSNQFKAYGGKIKPKTSRKYVGTKPLKTP